MTFVPFPEYRPDVNDYQGQHTQVLSGVLPRGDGWGPVANLQAYSQALPGTCRGYFFGRKTDGSIVVFAATSTRLYKLDNSSLAWTDVSQGGLAYTAIPSTDQWQFVQFGDTIIAVQANVNPQAFVLSTDSAFSDLGGTPPQAKFVAVVGRFLVLTGITGNARRVQWSDLDGITTWTAGVGFSNSVDLPDGGVCRGVAGGEFGLVFQESVIRQLTYVPGAKPAFQMERATEDRGLIGGYSVCKAGDKVFFVSQEGFYEYAAGVGIVPIGKERVDRSFQADLDYSYLNLLIGAPDPLGTRVFWAYKSVRSSSTTLFDTIIAYDYGLERWSPPIAVSGEYMASIIKPGLTLDSLDSYGVSGTTTTGSPTGLLLAVTSPTTGAAVASLDALPFSLDSVQSALISKLSAFTSTHCLGFFDGANLEATLETPEQALDSYVRVRGFYPRTDASTCYGYVKSRFNAQASPVKSPETNLDIYGNCSQNVATKLVRAGVRIPAGTSWTYCMGIDPDFVPMGQRG